MADSNLPTPFNQFRLFKALSLTLYEYDWYNFVEQWQAMVAVNAPLQEFTYNLVPFFSNAKNILPVFHRYMGYVRQDPELLNTMTNVMMSTPLMIRVETILRSQPLFSNYVSALKLDNPSASHTQVMQAIQAFLSTLTAPTRLQVQRAFAETEASDSMGLSAYTLDTMFQLLHSDTQLYIDVLTTLQLNQTRNMAWDTVVSKVRTIVTAKRPQAWPAMDQFLTKLHWGHYQHQYSGYDGYDQYGDEGDYADYYTDEADYQPHFEEQDPRAFTTSSSSSSSSTPVPAPVSAAAATASPSTFQRHSEDQAVVDRFGELSVSGRRPADSKAQG